MTTRKIEQAVEDLIIENKMHLQFASIWDKQRLTKKVAAYQTVLGDL